MNSVLDFIGAILYAVVSVVTAPLVLLVHLMIGSLLLAKTMNAMVRRIALPSRPHLHLPRFRFNTGKAFHS